MTTPDFDKNSTPQQYNTTVVVNAPSLPTFSPGSSSIDREPAALASAAIRKRNTVTGSAVSLIDYSCYP
jgi:hypothetical protein